MKRLTTWLAVLLCACGGGGGPPAATTANAPVTATIGSQGGTITGPAGAVLRIPEGALASDTQITIAVDASNAPPAPPTGTQVGPMLSLTPHGLTFGAPVTLTVPFDPAGVPAGQSVSLLKSNAANDAWQQLVTERDGDTLTASITSFSTVVRFCCFDPIRIIDQPDDQTTFDEGFAFFRVEVLGFDRQNIRLQWYRNGLPMPGETNPEILLPRVTLADDNTLYMARVNYRNSVFEDSRAARLLVLPIPPRIVNQPLDAHVVAGQFAQFDAASTSSQAQTLQWQRSTPGSDTNFTDIPGETATRLLFAAQAGDDGRRYRMCATNSAGTTCSRGALLTVTPQPTQPVITQQPAPVSTVAGASATFTVLATGGALSYVWQSRRAGEAFADEPRCGNSATCTISSVSLADDGLFFRVLLSNSAGSAQSAEALLTVRLDPGAVLARVLGGNQHSLGLRANGLLRAWGANDAGQLGDGTFDARTDAVDVTGITDVATFAVGAQHTIALRTNGEVWTWGGNDWGELGDGTLISRATPARVAGIGPARAAAGSLFGFSHSVVALADGTVWAWGNNDSGQLGDGTTSTRTTPVRSGFLTDVVRVAAASGVTFALRGDGTVWAWGANNGRFGDGTTTGSTVPVPVPMPAPIVAIAAGYANALALTGDGTVLAWGRNGVGEVGDGTTEVRLQPTPVALPAPAIAIAAGGNHSLALLLDGRVYAWGWNAYGQCGCSDSEEDVLTPQPVRAPLPAAIVAIGAGINHSLALAADGTVWGWGHNFSGQLNDGSTMNERATPVQVRNVNLNN